MVAADLMRSLSLLHLRWVELVHDQPRARGLTRRVWAVRLLEHHALESETGERLAPRAEAAGYIWREPDVRARRHEPLEMALPFEQRDAHERIAVDLQQIERAEDLPARGLAGEGVALRIDLEVAVVLPVRDEDAVEDRAAAMRLRLDRVEELARTVDRTVVAHEPRPVVADPDERPGPLPGRLEDVVRQLRLLPHGLRALRRELHAEDRRLHRNRVFHALIGLLTVRTCVL